LGNLGYLRFLGFIYPNRPNNHENFNSPMIIGGLQKFSLLDYPGRISAIVFVQGCNFRCRFCYNPMLVWPAPASSKESGAGKLKYAACLSESLRRGRRQKVHPTVRPTPASREANPAGSRWINQDDLFVFLKSRIGKLDAVVITGGEPCQQNDLPKFIKKIKEWGFLVKLDTNGSNPEMLEKLIKEKSLDYLAMDLKAPAGKYQEVTGVKADLNKIKRSVKIIMTSGLPYEFRTTLVPELIDTDDISKIGEVIKGADLWYLQNFKGQGPLVCSGLVGKVPYNARQMQEMAEIGRQYAKKCELR
jgi:pyruvate formate lyase activating enzyme